MNSEILNMLKFNKTIIVETVDDIYKLITRWQFYYFSKDNRLSEEEINAIKQLYFDGLKLGKSRLINNFGEYFKLCYQ